jgi:hypothetical protein
VCSATGFNDDVQIMTNKSQAERHAGHIGERPRTLKQPHAPKPPAEEELPRRRLKRLPLGYGQDDRSIEGFRLRRNGHSRGSASSDRDVERQGFGRPETYR